MFWERLNEYAGYRLGDRVYWSEGACEGTILEIACSPEGPVFWLSCAPYWVKPEVVCPALGLSEAVGLAFG
ncbi:MULTISPECIES: hypothetical protein [unclassified Meiothermus]|uniref:hypothetical protein n=1 Tax=unclassified Meiothermus TaxID=370471 RepID=UPI000D7C86D9|nr:MULTISPECIES: hypothetical protein [unclassified Meiothermus]PZA06520.1 hypothetical protein DNA98_13125 [Meiothermus sp. Pnk-1]RYM37195.1 hypothetical protein EWH23_06885 [Meiothermus sp. PNK-Is4]